MGWKTLKQSFGITHNVCVTDKGVCIGSDFVHDLATINPSTGGLIENEAQRGFLARYYPALLSVTSTELLALIKAEDQFDASISVYTFSKGSLLEKQCEQTGFPNVTHDGELMYANTFSTDLNEVIAWAKRDAQLKVEFIQEHLERLKRQIVDTEVDLESALATANNLQTAHENGFLIPRKHRSANEQP